MFARNLVILWAVLIVATGAALLFPAARWTPGPEVLLSLSAVTILLTCVYALKIALRQVRTRIGRK